MFLAERAASAKALWWKEAGGVEVWAGLCGWSEGPQGPLWGMILERDRGQMMQGLEAWGRSLEFVS